MTTNITRQKTFTVRKTEKSPGQYCVTNVTKPATTVKVATKMTTKRGVQKRQVNRTFEKLAFAMVTSETCILYEIFDQSEVAKQRCLRHFNIDIERSYLYCFALYVSLTGGRQELQRYYIQTRDIHTNSPARKTETSASIKTPPQPVIVLILFPSYEL